MYRRCNPESPVRFWIGAPLLKTTSRRCETKELMTPKDKAALTISELLKTGVIPTNNYLFEITENHLDSFIRVYDTYSDGLRRTDKGDTAKSYRNRINYPFARKMAGRDLVAFKLERGAKTNQCKEGFIYSIGNPAWPNHLKIGMSSNVEKRLAGYQTYSPLRDYYRVHYEFVLNKRQTEKDILTKFNHSIESGEWLKDTSVESIIEYINKSIPRKPSWI